jgi:hypothetical protein
MATSSIEKSGGGQEKRALNPELMLSKSACANAQFLPIQRQSAVIEKTAVGIIVGCERRPMKKVNRWLKLEPADVVLLLGLTTGLGLAVHEVFFLLALVIVLVVVGQWTVKKAHEYLCDLHLRPKHT